MFIYKILDILNFNIRNLQNKNIRYKKKCINELPTELLEVILYYINIDYEFIVKSVCKRWNFIINNKKRREQKYMKTKTPRWLASCSLSFLKWSRDNGYQMDETTCSNAAYIGKLNVIKVQA